MIFVGFSIVPVAFLLDKYGFISFFDAEVFASASLLP